MEKTFKRGQRVRYVGDNPHWKDRLGTVTGDKPGRFNLIRIRFDYQQPYEKGMECRPSSFEAYEGTDDQTELRTYEEAFTRNQWQTIADALTLQIVQLPDRADRAQAQQLLGRACLHARAS